VEEGFVDGLAIGVGADDAFAGVAFGGWRRVGRCFHWGSFGAGPGLGCGAYAVGVAEVLWSLCVPFWEVCGFPVTNFVAVRVKATEKA
jgi:hypothetical protein